MGYEIKTRNITCYAEQIQRLADKNSKTLGFIPGKAYIQFAQENHIYCAVEDDVVIAYVLFRHTKKTNKIVLVHVCVDSSYRKSGLAKELIDTVIAQYPFAYLVEARCRYDYNIEAFWKSCGFHVISEKQGRSQFGSRLVIWQRKIQTVDLLYLAQKAEAEKKIVAVLDTNIIIELCEKPNGSASCLEDASISDYVTYQITPECLDEINLKADAKIRQQHLEFANRYPKTTEPQAVSCISQQIAERYDPQQNHVADIRHLAHCIDGEADVFITNDTWICNLREAFRTEYGVDILRPEEFYATIEERFDEHAYIAETLVGSQYSEALLSLEELKDASELAAEANQKKKEFTNWLRGTLIQSDEDVYLIKQAGLVVGLYSLKHCEEHYEITQFIISNIKVPKSIRAILSNAVLTRIIDRISKNGHLCTALVIKSEAMEHNASIVTDHIFLQTRIGGIKIIVNSALTVNELLVLVSEYLKKITGKLLSANEVKALMANYRNVSTQNPIMLENLLSPAILLDSMLPVWIIPIKPQYAVRLFDSKLANTNPSFLHNEHEFAAFSEQNSYYTKAKRTFVTPCRILWYVSYHQGYMGSGAIRACSIMRSAETDTKKALFTRHKKYGVLSWDEMNTIEADDILRVFTFDNTRSLSTPIPYENLKQMVKSVENKTVQLTSPNLVSNTVFLKLIQKGMENSECTS